MDDTLESDDGKEPRAERHQVSSTEDNTSQQTQSSVSIPNGLLLGLLDCCFLLCIDNATLQHRDWLVLLAPRRPAGQQAQMLCGPSFHIRRSAHISALVALLVWGALQHVYDSLSFQLVTEVE